MIWPFNKLFGRSKPPSRKDPFADFNQPLGPGRKAGRLSRDEGGDDSRLHRDYWAGASDISINALIVRHLSTWRRRCRFEAQNNPTIKGMMRTFRDDVVGARGPKLDIRTQNTKFNQEAESLWENWFRMPDVAGRVSGVDMLKLDCNQLWTHGSYLHQIVIDQSLPVNGIQMRIANIDARRLASPVMSGAGQNIVLGIELTPFGKPIAYNIEQINFADLAAFPTYVKIPAANMVHGFELLEPEQITGIPWLKWMLTSEADRRQYDRYVMEAAKYAAAQAVYIFTESPDVQQPQIITGGEPVDVEPATATMLPPGHKFGTTTAQQPAAQYESYSRIRLSQTGRPVNMPYGTVALDYSNLSFSAARLMMNTYWGGLACDRANIDRTNLNYLFFILLAEAELKGLITIPDEPIRLDWTWPSHPSVDPKADAQAATERLANLTSTLELEAAEDGVDFDDLVASHKRCKAFHDEIGIDYPITKQGAAGNTPQNDTGSDTGNPPPSNGMGSNGHGRLNGLAATGRYHG